MSEPKSQASNGGTEFTLGERFDALIDWLEQIEREGCEPWSIASTTALAHARTLAEDVAPHHYCIGPDCPECVP